MNKSLIAFHIVVPNKTDIKSEKKSDFVAEKFIMLNALVKIIVSPLKKAIQLDTVLGLPKGKGVISLMDQSFSFDFIRSAKIKPASKQITPPTDNQNIGSSRVGMTW